MGGGSSTEDSSREDSRYEELRQSYSSMERQLQDQRREEQEREERRRIDQRRQEEEKDKRRRDMAYLQNKVSDLDINKKKLESQVQEYKRKEEEAEIRRKREKLEEPWREDITEWDIDKAQHLLDIVKKTNPEEINSEVECYNVLLMGEVQAGKSSTINTLYGCLLGEIVKISRAERGQSSITTKYITHKLRTKDGQVLKIKLGDSMGLLGIKDKTEGMLIEEFRQIINGEIPDKYEFQAAASEDAKPVQLKQNPRLGDTIHCIVLVLDANNVMETEVIQLLKQYKNVADKKDICACVLITKIDEISEMVKKDTSTVYHSRSVQQLVQTVVELSGLDENDIFPIRNIVQQTEMHLAVKEQVLALTALKKIINCCKTTLYRKC